MNIFTHNLFKRKILIEYKHYNGRHHCWQRWWRSNLTLYYWRISLIYMEYNYGGLSILKCMRYLVQCGWTLNQHSNNQVYFYYFVAVKKQLGIFHDVYYMLFSVSPNKGYYCKVRKLTIFCRLTSVNVARNKHNKLIF